MAAAHSRAIKYHRFIDFAPRRRGRKRLPGERTNGYSALGLPENSNRYLPGPVYEALRKIAFEERLKIHDIVLEGIDAALRRRGYASVENLKAGKKR